MIPFIEICLRRFKYYKQLADRSFAQLSDNDFYYQPDPVSNSLEIIIQHMHGNMMSRWTNFLSEDGEKTWRQRDEEFTIHHHSRTHLLELWEKGWSCLFDTLSSMKEDDLQKTIYIRGEGLTAMDAIIRQMAHYPYHVGQIVYLARMIKKESWQNLSIEPGKSAEYNAGSGIKDPARNL